MDDGMTEATAAIMMLMVTETSSTTADNNYWVARDKIVFGVSLFGKSNGCRMMPPSSPVV